MRGLGVGEVRVAGGGKGDGHIPVGSCHSVTAVDVESTLKDNSNIIMLSAVSRDKIQPQIEIKTTINYSNLHLEIFIIYIEKMGSLFPTETLFVRFSIFILTY